MNALMFDKGPPNPKLFSVQLNVIITWWSVPSGLKQVPTTMFLYRWSILIYNGNEVKRQGHVCNFALYQKT